MAIDQPGQNGPVREVDRAEVRGRLGGGHDVLDPFALEHECPVAEHVAGRHVHEAAGEPDEALGRRHRRSILSASPNWRMLPTFDRYAMGDARADTQTWY